MIKTLNDFKKEFNKIKEMGWITTHRSGTTGIGKTLEDLLKIKENNDQKPDFGKYELKATRSGSNSMLTLFTKSPSPKGSNTKLRLDYGYSSSKYNSKEKVLHSTLNAHDFVNISNTKHKLKATYRMGDIDKIYIESEKGLCDAYWEIPSLERAFKNKYKNKLVYAKAMSNGNEKNEKFRFIEAYECKFDFNKFLALLQDGKIYIDLRIGQHKNGRTHDHGTGFRIRECDQDKLFIKKKIC